MNISSDVFVLLTALILDQLFGEPPNRFHPVAWMGTTIGWARKSSPSSNSLAQFVWGTGIVVLGAGAAVAAGILIDRLCVSLPLILLVAIQAWILKTTFGFRSLGGVGTSIADLLNRGQIQEARQQVAYHLVSRDTTMLSETQLSAATIESIAENTSDSVIGPLLFFAVAGLPGALAYRYVNTCDAMLGYRTVELEWLGKPAARFDDLLNLFPARFTAILMLAVGSLQRSDGRKSAMIWWHQCRRTTSPNAGHPISAAAGVLSVELEKVGVYCIGNGLAPPTATSVAASVRLLSGTVWLAAGLVAVFLICRGAWL